MPEIRFQDGATLRDISAVYYQDGATLRDVQKAYYQDGATLRLVWEKYTPMSGSMGDLNGAIAAILWITLGTATCSVTGGNPSKSYTFSIINDPFPANFRVLSVSGNQATVQGQRSSAGISTANLKCVVDDGDNSIDVLCDLTYERI